MNQQNYSATTGASESYRFHSVSEVKSSYDPSMPDLSGKSPEAAYVAGQRRTYDQCNILMTRKDRLICKLLDHCGLSYQEFIGSQGVTA